MQAIPQSLRVEDFTGLVLELTNRCQLRCKNCPRESVSGKAMETGFMPFESFRKVIDEAGISLKVVGLSGLGETFLYPYLCEAAGYLQRAIPGGSAFISTNACAPDCPEIFSRLPSMVRTLQISIDGIGEAFERMRSPAQYGDFLRNVRELVRVAERKKTVLQFNMVLTPENFRQAGEVVLLAGELGIPRVCFNPVNWVTENTECPGYHFLESPEFLDSLEEARQFARREDIRLEIPVFKKGKGPVNCEAPWDSFYVTWDGFLVPCCAKPFPKEKHFGNVFRDGLRNCVNRNEFLWFRRLWAENITPEFCRHCHLVCG
ncbi:MAG TPA: radical SAM protein [Candidatus Omnitrophota bacterium]|nr:radical SAM protein [Candidatus Omnitrophota bacterium]